MDEIEAIIRKYIEDVNFYDTLEDAKAIVDIEAMIKEVVDFRIQSKMNELGLTHAWKDGTSQ